MATRRAKPAAAKSKKPPEKKQILVSELPPLEKLLVMYLRLYGKKSEQGWSRILSRKKLAQVLSASVSGASETVRDLVQRGMVRVEGNVGEDGVPRANTLVLLREAMERLVREPREHCYSGVCLRSLQGRERAYERGIEQAAKELRKGGEKGPKRKKHTARPWRLQVQAGSAEANALWKLASSPTSPAPGKKKAVEVRREEKEQEEQVEQKAKAYWLAKGDLQFAPEVVAPGACLAWVQKQATQRATDTPPRKPAPAPMSPGVPPKPAPSTPPRPGAAPVASGARQRPAQR